MLDEPSTESNTGSPDTQRLVGIVVFNDALLLNIAGSTEGFATANRECVRHAAAQGAGTPIPPYRTVTLSVFGGLITTSCGTQIVTVPLSAPQWLTFDTLVLVGGGGVQAACADRVLVDWIRAAAPRTRRLAAVGNGAFLLAAAGLLDGRRCVTHWMYAEALRAAHPRVTVDTDAVFLRDGSCFTSAGATAAIDLVMQLIEEDLGRPAALSVARALVVYMRRSGSTPQVSNELLGQEAALPRIERAAAWLTAHLAQPVTVADVARQAAMSERNFARRFRQELGLSPHQYLERARLEQTRRLLVETDLPIDKLARRTGFASGERLAAVFRKQLKMTPSEFRERHRGRTSAEAAAPIDPAEGLEADPAG